MERFLECLKYPDELWGYSVGQEDEVALGWEEEKMKIDPPNDGFSSCQSLQNGSSKQRQFLVPNRRALVRHLTFATGTGVSGSNSI